VLPLADTETISRSWTMAKDLFNDQVFSTACGLEEEQQDEGRSLTTMLIFEILQ
jgi:hypothetical protein